MEGADTHLNHPLCQVVILPIWLRLLTINVFSLSHGGWNFCVGSDSGQPVGQLGNCGRDDNILVEDSTSRPEDLRVLSSLDWPDIRYHVSSQEISLHIPLHRLLSIFLLRALKEWYGESVSSHAVNAGSVEQSFIRHGDFLSQILVGSEPYGFSGSVMEHPLRIRAFVAQVHAKMWIRNGDAPKLFSEWYRSVCWYVLLQLVVELIHHFVFVFFMI